MKHVDLDFDHYNSLINSIPVVVVLMDMDKNILYMNKPAEKTLSTTVDVEKGNNFFDKFMKKTDSDYIKAATKNFIERGDIDQLKTKDGYQYFKWYVVTIQDKNNNDLLFLAAHNINDLVNRDLELISIFNTFSDLYLWINYGGTINRCETGIVNDLYIEKSHFIGNQIQSLLPLDIARLFDRAIQNTINTKKVTRIEYELNVPSGKKYFEARMSIIDINNIMCIIRDITDRIESERNLTTLINKLPQQQKIEVVELLTKDIAHDFNNIFYIIMMSIESIIDKCNKCQYPCPTCKNQKLYNAIYNAVKRGSNIIKDLLSFSETSPIHIDTISLNDELRNFVDDLRTTFPENITLITNFDETILPINVDKDQIREIITRLCSNSKEALDNTVGKIIIETECKYLSEQDIPQYQIINPNLNSGNYTCFKISDTGSGIDPSLIRKIFTPFFSTKETPKGTGLGLSIVYKIVQQYNGIITCRSIPNKLTTFTICLPCSDAIVGSRITAVNIYSKTSKSLLLIDDEKTLTSITKDFLEAIQYPIFIANDCQSGVDIIKNNINKIDIVILDLISTSEDAIDCVNNLLQVNPNLKFIISTGKLTTVDDIKYCDSIKSILYKPYSIKVLTTAVDKIRSKETNENN